MSDSAADADVPLLLVPVCKLCLEGAGGECHAPGCVFWLCDAPPEGANSCWPDLALKSASDAQAWFTAVPVESPIITAHCHYCRCQYIAGNLSNYLGELCCNGCIERRLR